MGVTEQDVKYRSGRTVTEYRSVEQCRTVYESRQVQNGYVVTFSYNNLIGNTVVSNYPGSTIEINLSLGN
jgi:uncharacterized protein YcfJ